MILGKAVLRGGFCVCVVVVVASKWTEEEKQKALAIARSTSAREAVRATGIPLATVGRWLSEQKRNGTERPEQNGTPKKLEVLRQEAIERAVEKAGDYIAERLKGLADQLYNLAEKATTKVDVAISDPEELPKGKRAEPHDRDGSAWVRALVGVMAQAVDKAQLLSGKPTSRQEQAGQVTNRHEYDITYCIEQYADVYRNLARRSTLPGLDARDGSGEPMDPARSDP